MDIVEILWLVGLFVAGFFAGFLTGNFFGRSRAETMRYKYLSGELK